MENIRQFEKQIITFDTADGRVSFSASKVFSEKYYEIIFFN